ncbi:MAG: transferase 1, rSAM/selenodomain-associated [Firmicutes bacterium]|nr:transferase 1, rSAM/selenodomain-associated [Bacillota bacterium]
MRNAIVVFTKVPKAGETKTRLTTDRGGILSPEEAMAFYEGCLLDVINVCIEANCGDIRVCYNHDGDREYLEKLLSRVCDRAQIKEVYPDKGGNFDQCMQYAADYILKNGAVDRLAESVIIVGGDLPSLQPVIIQDAVCKLELLAASENGRKIAKKLANVPQELGAALVEGACQEGGFSVVGFTCTTPFDFNRVFYNNDGVTALDMLVAKAQQQDIPFGIVEAASDVDIPVDLASMIPVVKALELAARSDKSIRVPANTLGILRELGLESSTAIPHR